MPKSKRHPARRPQQRSPRTDQRPSATGRSGAETSRAPATGWRAALERRSAGPLIILHRLPSWLVPVLLAILLVAGLALPRPAQILLLVPGVFLAWLLSLSWPITSASGRLMRLFVVALLFAATVLKSTGTFGD